MAFITIFFSKSSEKKEYVADVDSLISKMGLSRANLPKSTSIIMKHRIEMALRSTMNSTARCGFYCVTKTNGFIRRSAASLQGYWETYRPPIYYRRTTAAGSLIDAFATEHYSHDILAPLK